MAEPVLPCFLARARHIPCHGFHGQASIDFLWRRPLDICVNITLIVNVFECLINGTAYQASSVSDVLAGSGGIGVETPMLWLAREAPETALCAAVTATAALWWPDEMVGKAANFCRCPTDSHCLSLPLWRGAFPTKANPALGPRSDGSRALLTPRSERCPRRSACPCNIASVALSQTSFSKRCIVFCGVSSAAASQK